MISSKHRLNRITGRRFIDADSDLSSPSGNWYRHFNLVSLELKNVVVSHSYYVHEEDCSSSREDYETEDEPIAEDMLDQRKHIVSKSKNVTSIHALVDEDNLKEHIYCVVKDSENDEQYMFEKPKEPMQVTISSSESIQKDSKEFNLGVYPGTCFRLDFQPNEDGIYFDLYMPEKQIEMLVKKINLYPDKRVVAQIMLLSFSSQMDDSLREIHWPRDLFIPGSGAAFLGTIDVYNRKESPIEVQNRNESLIEGQNEDEEVYIERETEVVENISINKNLNQIIKSLNYLVIAMWVLTLVITMIAIF